MLFSVVVFICKFASKLLVVKQNVCRIKIKTLSGRYYYYYYYYYFQECTPGWAGVSESLQKSQRK